MSGQAGILYRNNVVGSFQKGLTALEDLHKEKPDFHILPLKFIMRRTLPGKAQCVTDIVEIPLFEIIKMYDHDYFSCDVLISFLHSYCGYGFNDGYGVRTRYLEWDGVGLIKFMEKKREPLFKYIDKYYPTETNPDPKEIKLAYMSVKHMDVDLLKEKKELSKKEKKFLSGLYLKDAQINLHFIQQILSTMLFHGSISIKPAEGFIDLELLGPMSTGVLNLIEDFFCTDSKPTERTL